MFWNKKRKPQKKLYINKVHTAYFEQSNRNVKKRRSVISEKKQLTWLKPSRSLLILIILILIGSSFVFFFSGVYAIKTVNITNIDNITSELKFALEDQYKTLKGQNIIRLDKESLTNEIKTQFNQIQSIKIEKDYPTTLNISIQEYPLVANLIHESPQLKKTVIINSSGLLAKENFENPSLLYITMQSEEPINPDQAIIETQKLRYILEAATYFQDRFGMKLKEIEYKPIAREIRLKTEKGFSIWLDIQRPAEEQLKKLKKAIIKLDIYNTPLEYIDLRIAGGDGEKIIYK